MEKGGLKTRIQAGLETLGNAAKGLVAFGDEMRLGLLGQVRRVLAPKGVKIIQPLQREYKKAGIWTSWFGMELVFIEVKI